MERWDATEVKSGEEVAIFFRQIYSTTMVVLTVRTQQRLRKCNNAENTTLNKKTAVFNTDVIL